MANLMKEIFHVCKKSTATGSRVRSQNSICNSKVLPYDGWFPNAELIRLLFTNREAVFVFHQQQKLPSLVISFLFSQLFGKGHVFVYDMHDLSEFNSRMSFLGRANCRFSMALERLVCLLDVRIVTVSRGLQSTFIKKNDYRKDVFLVYNIDQEQSNYIQKKTFDIDPMRIVYFGQIKEDRIDLRIFESLIEAGYSIDLYGKFKLGDDRFKNSILMLISRNGGCYLGPYSPDDTNFLRGYGGCIMYYDSDLLNIRYCMPNKLFQSLSNGLVCLVSDLLLEAISEFEEYGCVQRYSMIAKEAVSPDFEAASRHILKLKELSRVNYLAAVMG
jgi:hypothetical protein